MHDLQSRHAMGVILGFIGFKEEVAVLMQVLSHSTRAYIKNANMLPGFLCPEPTMQTLAMLETNKALTDVYRF